MSRYEDIVNLALRRGIFFPSSEIYQNSPAGFFDFGPYGTTIRRKIIEQWRKHFVQAENYMEIDGAIVMPEDVFKASGHLDSFNDPMTACKKCNTIHRADKLLEDVGVEANEGTSIEELSKALQKHKVTCPKCKKGELGEVKQFNLMLKAEVGVGSKSVCYLRPESCQSIFTAWNRIKDTMRVKLPQGIAQVGKAYRNEINPRQTLIREIEFYQMEAEVFFDPEKINDVEKFEEVKNYKLRIQLIGKEKVENITCQKLADDKSVSGKLIAYYLARTQQLFERYGIPLDAMRFREVSNQERAFYAKEGWDFEVKTSLGWIELIANNYRTDYDLKQHSKISGKDLKYCYPDGKKITPHVWETSIGVDRTFLVTLEHAYREEDGRKWLALPNSIVPLQAGILPLVKNKPLIVAKAKEVYTNLRECYEVFYDESGSVGKRYARLDEVGVPYCITIDFDTLEKDDSVTIRARDTTKQKRIKIANLQDTLYKLITGKEGL